MAALDQKPINLQAAAKGLEAAKAELAKEFQLMRGDSGGPGMGAKVHAITHNVLRMTAIHASFLSSSEEFQELQEVVSRGFTAGREAVESYGQSLRTELGRKRREANTPRELEQLLTELRQLRGPVETRKYPGIPETLESSARSVDAIADHIEETGFSVEDLELFTTQMLTAAEATPLVGPAGAKDLAAVFLRAIRDRAR